MRARRFRLEAVLKLRRFRERALMREAGRIVSDLVARRGRADALARGARACRKAREEAAAGGLTAGALAVHSEAAESHLREMGRVAEDVAALEGRHRDKARELEAAMGQVRAMERRREEHVRALGRAREAESRGEVEEIVQRRKAAGC